MRWLIGFVIVFLAGWGYLSARQWFDRKKEKAQDIEIIREGEEYLGTWASKSKEALTRFRFHRDGTFSYSLVQFASADSTAITGKYHVVGAGGGNDIAYFPRLIAVDDKNDTVMNYYIAYITPYDSYASNNGYDKMVLSPNGRNDSVSYTFFRIREK